MRKKMFKRRLLSAFLAGALVTASAHFVRPIEIYAEEGGDTAKAQRSFDKEYDTQNAYDGNDLGCTYTPEKTTFKVWSPEADEVVLCRYEKGNGGSAISETPMTKGDKGVWCAEVPGDIVNTYYTYKVTVNGSTQEAVDIYAKAAGVNGDRAMVVNLDGTDPENWDKNYQREETLLSDIIVWETHIRDFSIDASSGVSEQNRGKYKAFTESTTINGEGRAASCVDYLKELGVTHVQLLPMFDYASVDEENVSTSPGDNYSWGYDPKNYNVPEGSYSTDPYDGSVRIKEMKEMIQALHDAGIKVVMDVAYSHTCDAADSNFNKIMPDYYYKINSDMSYNNQSGYGNTTRSDSAMYRKFMIDSVSYWAEEYNLDGFRFDLMGAHDLATMNQIRNALDDKFGKNTVILYGEGRTADGYDSKSAHKANESRLDNGIGYFNEQIRDGIMGEPESDGAIGFVQTNYIEGSYLESDQRWPDNVFGGIMGSTGYTSGEWGMWRPFWSKSSNCCLSYASVHDGLTLWDKLAGGLKEEFSSTDDRMKRMNKMAGGLVLVSKGGVFMQAGEEFARTKNGDGGSGGCSSSDLDHKIDWSRVNTYSDIQKFYQGMIRIRKAFSGFRSVLTRSGDNWEPTNNNIQWISKEETGVTAFYETNDVSGEWNRIAVLVNNTIENQTVSLTGSDEWVIIADGTTAGLEKIRESGPDVTVPGKSVTVAVPKATFENKPPVITCETSFRVTEGESLSFTVGTSDPNGDTVTLKAGRLPEGASFDVSTGAFTWESPAAGKYEVTLTADDGNASTTKTITITVESGKDPANPGDKPTNPGGEPTNPDDEPANPDDEPTNPGGEPTNPGGEPPAKEPIQPVKELKITGFTLGKKSGIAQVGDTVSISVKAEGGVGVIKYRFCVKKGSTTTIKNYSTSKSAKWKPKKAGKYSLMVYAKDEKGTVVKKTISKYTVNSKLKVTGFKASPSSKKAKAGKKVELTAKASGGTKKYQYKFGYKKSGTKKIMGINNYSSKKTVNWRPKKPGTYTLYAYVRDKTTKKVAKKTVSKYIVN